MFISKNPSWAIALIALACSGCFNQGLRNLTTSPVALGTQPLVIHPSPPLRTGEQWTFVAISFPEGYTIDDTTKDNWRIRDPNGTLISVNATLTTSEGVDQVCRLWGSLGESYCLTPVNPPTPGTTYQTVSLRSSSPLPTTKIEWFNTNPSL